MTNPVGRPKGNPKVNLNALVSPELKHRLRVLAAQLGCPQSDLVNEALTQYLEEM